MKVLFCLALTATSVAHGYGGLSLRHLQLDEDVNITMAPNETAVPTPDESAGEDIDVDGSLVPATTPPTTGRPTLPPTTGQPTPLPTTLSPTLPPTTSAPTNVPTLAPVPVPPNDLCVNAQGPLPITGKSLDGSLEVITQGTTVGATKQDMDRCGPRTTGPGVWYTVTGNGASVTASTCWEGSTLDTKLSVFSGSCSALTCIGGNEDAEKGCGVAPFASQFKWDTQIGATYYILVHGIAMNVGDFELNVFGSQDQCEFAAPLSVGDSITDSVAGAAVPFDGVMDNCDGTGYIGIAPGLWYEVMGTGSAMKVTVCPDPNVNGRPFKVHVFESSCEDQGSCIGGNAPFTGCAIEEWGTSAGTPYYILVHNHAFPGNGIFTLTLENGGTGTQVERNQIFD